MRRAGLEAPSRGGTRVCLAWRGGRPRAGAAAEQSLWKQEGPALCGRGSASVVLTNPLETPPARSFLWESCAAWIYCCVQRDFNYHVLRGVIISAAGSAANTHTLHSPLAQAPATRRPRILGSSLPARPAETFLSALRRGGGRRPPPPGRPELSWCTCGGGAGHAGLLGTPACLPTHSQPGLCPRDPRARTLTLLFCSWAWQHPCPAPALTTRSCQWYGHLPCAGHCAPENAALGWVGQCQP